MIQKKQREENMKENEQGRIEQRRQRKGSLDLETTKGKVRGNDDRKPRKI